MSPGRGNGIRSLFSSKRVQINWHDDMAMATHTGRWDAIRTHLSHLSTVQETAQALSASAMHLSASTNLCLSDSDDDDEDFMVPRRTPPPRKTSSFWKRLGVKRGKEEKQNSNDPTGLLSVDQDGRTPLHIALTTTTTSTTITTTSTTAQIKKCPTDVLLTMIQVEPKAATLANSRGRLPIHFAVVHQHPIEIIAELVDAYPNSLSAVDCQGMSPLAYAMDTARRLTYLHTAPQQFWMPTATTADASWQTTQREKWSVVHWLLLASATHPQTSLSLGEGEQPMLVDALVHAAPPAVISLLIGASVMLLSYENRATAFAASTLYSCIARHYPLAILMGLASHCPGDVHLVRDETGMGLVSSQFISGCYEVVEQQHEDDDWIVCEDFYQRLRETIARGDFDVEDLAFIDWWKKVEFLLAFCSGMYRPSAVPKAQLLHAALKNSDTPQDVTRLLLALYPQSIRARDQETGATPLYLVASQREYVPRSYEVDSTSDNDDTGTTLEMILNLDPEAVSQRIEGRLPLHAAIGSGRIYQEFHSMVRPEFCWEPDPNTGLYPFLQAASYTRTKKDDFRTTCIARNHFSYGAWKCMSSHLKARAVVRVAAVEDLDRLGTVYELLRLQPGVLERVSSRKKPARDGTGMGAVAAHFISWYYVQERSKRVPNLENTETLRMALVAASSPSAFGELPVEFSRWWDEMKALIRSSCSKLSPWDGKIPIDNDKFLLHAAVSNPDTPPQVIQLLLERYPDSASLPVPGTSSLPLHIAAHTGEYTSRIFETVECGSLELVYKAFPKASNMEADGCLPLQLALRKRKTWREISCLVEQNPECLLRKDSSNGLYPFQQMAVKKGYTAEERLRFQFLARNGYEEEVWQSLSPPERTKQVRNSQKEYQLDVLSSILELLRRNVSLVPHSDVSTGRLGDSHILSLTADMEPAEEEEDDEEEGKEDHESSSDSSSSAVVSFFGGHLAPQKKPVQMSPLELMLSDHENEGKDDDEMSVFECDTSLLSNVDVMSVLSTSRHTAFNQDHRLNFQRANSYLERQGSRRSLNRNDSHRSIQRQSSRSALRGSTFSSGRYMVQHDGSDTDDSTEKVLDEQSLYIDSIEESEYDEFAEDSCSLEDLVDGGRKSVSNSPVKQLPSLQEVEREHESANLAQGSDNEDDEEELVYFLMRKVPRIKSRAKHDFRLKKRRNVSISFESHIKTTSSHRRTTIGSEFKKMMQTSSHSSASKASTNITSSHHSNSTSNTGYISLQQEEKEKIKTEKEQMWIGDKIYKDNLLGTLDGESSSQWVSDESEKLLGISPPGDSSITSSSGTSQSQKSPSFQRLGDLKRTASINSKKNGVSIPLNPKLRTDKLSLVNGQDDTTEPSRKDDVLPGISSYLQQSVPTLNDSAGELSNTPSTLSYLIHKDDTGTSATTRSKAGSSTGEHPMYFDKASMMWKKRLPDQPAAPSCSSPPQHAPEMVNDAYFDKKEMRWKKRSASETGPQNEKAKPESADGRSSEVNAERERGPKSIQRHNGVPFVGIMSREDGKRRNKALLSSVKRERKSKEEGSHSSSSTVFREKWRSMLSSTGNRLCCLLCDENPRQVLMVPCRHLAICRKCSIENTKMLPCPLCKNSTTERIALF